MEAVCPRNGRLHQCRRRTGSAEATRERPCGNNELEVPNALRLGPDRLLAARPDRHLTFCPDASESREGLPSTPGCACKPTARQTGRDPENQASSGAHTGFIARACRLRTREKPPTWGEIERADPLLGARRREPASFTYYRIRGRKLRRFDPRQIGPLPWMPLAAATRAWQRREHRVTVRPALRCR